MNEVVKYEALPLSERQNYAIQIAGAAAMLPNGIRAGGPDQVAANAFLIMETGAMLGLHPIAALASVNIIEGKPSLSADLMVSVVRNAGHTVRISQEGTVEGGDYKAIVTVVRADDPDNPTTSVWTPHRAARAGLCTYEQGSDGVWRVTALSRNDTPLPWQLYTEALCKARAKSEACRDGASDCLNGARYTPEELGAEVDAAGDPIITRLGAAPEEPEEPKKPTALPKAEKRATTGKQGTRRKSKPEPKEEIIDAEIVTDETPEPEPQPAPEPEYVDRITGETYASQAEMDAAIRARVQARIAADTASPAPEPAQSSPEPEQEVGAESPTPFEVALAEEPENYTRQIEAASTQDELRFIWDTAQAANLLTHDLHVAIVAKKDELVAS